LGYVQVQELLSISDAINTTPFGDFWSWLIPAEKALCFLAALPPTGGEHVLWAGMKPSLMVLQSQLSRERLLSEVKCEKYINRK